MRRALCIAVDRYPAPNTLHGCVADGARMSALLSGHYGFSSVTTLFDERATHDAILGEMTALRDMALPGDVVAITYSGHGTYLPSLTEPDGRDEALVPINATVNDSKLITDDVLYSIFGKLHPEISLTLVFDSCFSGGMLRVALPLVSPSRALRARFLPRPAAPLDDPPASLFTNPRAWWRQRFITRNPVGARLLNQHRALLLAGCAQGEVSNETELDGHVQGAFTYALSHTLAAANYSATAKDAIGVTRRWFRANGFPDQHPTLVGDKRLLRAPLFSARTA